MYQETRFAGNHSLCYLFAEIHVERVAGHSNEDWPLGLFYVIYYEVGLDPSLYSLHI